MRYLGSFLAAIGVGIDSWVPRDCPSFSSHGLNEISQDNMMTKN